MRILRLFVLLAAVSVASASFAQADSAEGTNYSFAEGRGMLQNRTDQTARFAFGVRQQGDRQARGRLQFGTRSRESGGISISSENLTRLRVDKNTAVFGGRAVMEITTRDGTRRVEGTVIVHVVDDKMIGRGRDRKKVDTFKIVFTVPDSERKFEFSGTAKSESIKVGHRRGDRK